MAPSRISFCSHSLAMLATHQHEPGFPMPRWARKRCSSRSVTPSAIRQVGDPGYRQAMPAPIAQDRLIGADGYCRGTVLVPRPDCGQDCRKSTWSISAGPSVSRYCSTAFWQYGPPRSSQRAPERCGGSRRSLLLSIGRDGRGGVAQTDVMCPRCNVPAALRGAGPGGLNGLSPASVATSHSRFYIAL